MHSPLLPDIGRSVLGERIQVAGLDLHDGARVVGLQHLHGHGVHRLLEGQLDVVLAVKAAGRASEAQQRGTQGFARSGALGWGSTGAHRRLARLDLFARLGFTGKATQVGR